MKLEPPLANLVDRCQTICVAECCGIGAYDFSPIQIASYLIMWRGRPDQREIAELRSQVEAMKVNYGSRGASGSGVTIDTMNQVFTAGQIDTFSDELLANLDAALRLIELSESTRFQKINQRHGTDKSQD